jgi:excisionase family DNA binding protein
MSHISAADSLTELEPTLRTAEVARLLGVSPRAIRLWADAGRIECYRTLGGHRLFPASEVTRVVAELREGGSRRRPTPRGPKSG